MPKSKDEDLDSADVTEPDGAPVVDKFASVPTGERLPYSETPCPKCGNKTVMTGYGLAGGGMGTYWYCETEGCDYFEKQQDKP